MNLEEIPVVPRSKSEQSTHCTFALQLLIFDKRKTIYPSIEGGILK